MGYRLFLKVLAAEKQVPCRKFACAEQQRCSSERLACSAFVEYLRTGVGRSPLKEYGPEGAEFPIDRPKPSRELFAICDDDEPQHDLAKKAEDTVAQAILNRSDLDLAWGRG